MVLADRVRERTNRSASDGGRQSDIRYEPQEKLRNKVAEELRHQHKSFRSGKWDLDAGAQLRTDALVQELLRIQKSQKPQCPF